MRKFLNFLINAFTYNNEIKLLKRKILTLALKWAITLNIYKKNSRGLNETYCNVWSYDFLTGKLHTKWSLVKDGEIYFMGDEIDIYNYDISSILNNNNVNATTIGYAYDKIIESAKNGNIILLSAKEAQKKANEGIPILMVTKEKNHMAIVAPNETYNDSDGPFLGNVGEYNAFMFISDKRCLGDYWNQKNDILFVLFP